MMSQPGRQTITIYILPSIWQQSKGNQTMEFVQLIEYNKRNIFLQNCAENEAGRLVSDLFIDHLIVICSLLLIYFDSPRLAVQ